MTDTSQPSDVDEDFGRRLRKGKSCMMGLVEDADPVEARELFSKLGVEYDQLAEEDSDSLYTSDSTSTSASSRRARGNQDQNTLGSPTVTDLTQAAAQAMLALMHSGDNSSHAQPDNPENPELEGGEEEEEERDERIDRSAGMPKTYEEVKGEILESLGLNRQYQQELAERLEGIQAHKKRNTELQRKLHELHTQQTKITRRSISVTANPNTTIVNGKKLQSPFFVDADGQTPPDNKDTEKRRKFPVYKARRWTDKERENLAKGVRAENMRIMAEKLIASGEATMWDVQKMSQREQEMNLDGLNWDKISKLYVSTRKPTECLIQWTNQDHPLINKSNWTYTESKQLQRVVQEFHNRNWVAIAKALGTQRTAAQCFRHYQAHLNKAIQKRLWTSDEDRMLIEMVHVFGERNWQQIAHAMGTRTGQQCLHRWSKTLNPAIRRGRWDKGEDQALRNAVQLYGEGNWVKIQQHVLGRTDVQCRERWMNVLAPGIVRDEWQSDEDRKLMELIAVHGPGKWSRIAQDIEGRTDNQCWRRWKAMRRAEMLRIRMRAASSSRRRRRGKKRARDDDEAQSDSGDSNESLSSSERTGSGQAARKHPRRECHQMDNDGDGRDDDTADEGDDEGASGPDAGGKEKAKDVKKSKKKNKSKKGSKRKRVTKPRPHSKLTAADLRGLVRNFKISGPSAISSSLVSRNNATIPRSRTPTSKAATLTAGAETTSSTILTTSTETTSSAILNTTATGSEVPAVDPSVNSVTNTPHVLPLPPNVANSEGLLRLVHSDAFNVPVSRPGLLLELEQQTPEFRLMEERFEAMFAWPFLLGTLEQPLDMEGGGVVNGGGVGLSAEPINAALVGVEEFAAEPNDGRGSEP